MTAPSLPHLIRVFARIGVLSFGGPAAQIALMHDALVEKEKWLTEQDFLRALSFCMLLPGPEAMQLATYAGWRLHGTVGGLIAGALFVLPGAAVVLALAIGYAFYSDLNWVQGAFLGIKSAVILIVLQALLKLSKKALATPLSWALAIAAFIAIFAIGVPFPIIIGVAALVGLSQAHKGTGLATPMSHVHLPRTIMLWGALWSAPIAAAFALQAEFLTDIGLFFSKMAVVTFGGAYAVLAYMTQEVVQNYGWLSTAQMIDGLGLAETTPGPLILVTEFVGFLAGFQERGLGLGITAAALTLWVTFIPCFLWIFAGAPYVEHLARAPRIEAALKAVTSAVVGVIANLSVWFALHVFFTTLTPTPFLGTQLPVPVPGSLSLAALGLTVVAAILIFGLRLSLPLVLLVMALAGVAVQGLAM
ncbi:chromate efflux transporter [Cognatishimia sp. MH4019]|uniref:chromate efflux transporter n=1 Tax=Cognatishimia sp. MH4019 TaxID=2854030 RepID=UPI001CD4F1EF|nr:chromate efflux transporter [Cognatishimia sp. MH4019]